MIILKRYTRSYLKIKILVQDQGGAEFQPAGILKYNEDLKRGPNAEIGLKDYFEMASIQMLEFLCGAKQSPDNLDTQTQYSYTLLSKKQVLITSWEKFLVFAKSSAAQNEDPTISR